MVRLWPAWRALLFQDSLTMNRDTRLTVYAMLASLAAGILLGAAATLQLAIVLILG